jgi:hypothetical protein
VASLLGIKGETFLVFDEENPGGRVGHAGDILRCESVLEKGALLRRLWEVMRDLPVAQRAVFFFGFRDESGDDLLSLFLESKVATPLEIADELDFRWRG